MWDAVRNAGSEDLMDAMDLAYLSGQPPADVLKMSEHDIVNDELRVRQNKKRHYEACLSARGRAGKADQVTR